jgi:hypothetical protein
MKILKLFFIVYIIALVNSGCQAQQGVDEKQAIAMLKEFYTAYNTVWTTNHGPSKKEKLDSLQNKYCTQNLITKIREPYLDHDLLISDSYTEPEYLSTLSVIKDLTKINGYIVSYKAPNTDPQGKDYIEQITIHVTVVKERESYKIDSVK